MPPITAPDRSFMAGVPEQWDQDFGVTKEGLFTGEYPTQFVQDIPVALNQELAAYTPVGKDADGNIVEALRGSADPADDIQAIGIIMFPVTTGATGALPVGRILRGGCLNPDMLVWPASYTTTAHKLNAFEGAPSPTQIIVRGLSSYTPVLP